jgi:integrase
VGERLLRELQRKTAGRMLERRDFLFLEGGTGGNREVASALQHAAAPLVAGLQAAGAAERTSGFLFRNRRGNYLSQTNLLRRGLHPALKKLEQPKAGFHAFRRFRTTWLRKNRTPEDLIRFWHGHADETSNGRAFEASGRRGLQKRSHCRSGPGF